MKYLFFCLLIPAIALNINSCSPGKEDTSGALNQMDQTLDQSNSTDDEANPDIQNASLGTCYLLDNSTIDNATINNSSITNNSSIKSSTVNDCSTVTSTTVDNSSTIDNSTTSSSTINNSYICAQSTIDNSTIDNSTVCNSSTVQGGSTVRGSSTVNNSSTVQGGSTVSGNSTVDNGSIVRNNSTIQGGATVCNSIIDNSTIDNSTVCNENVTMSIVNGIRENMTVTETVPPTVSSTTIKVNSSGPYSAADSASTEYCNTDIKVTFNEAMDTDSITTNSNTSCSESLQVSSNSFSSCIPMGTPSASNSNMTFTIVPSANLSNSTTFKIRIKGINDEGVTPVKDTNGNPMSSDNTTGTGFSTSGDSGKNGC